MRPWLLALAYLCLRAGETPVPPLNPAAGPLPAGLFVQLRGGGGTHLLGEPLWLDLEVSAQRPVVILMEEGCPQVDTTIISPDGSREHVASSPVYACSGAHVLLTGVTRTARITTRINGIPAIPGRHRVSVFIDLGWGPERPDDPRRVSVDIDWREPAEHARADLVARQFALQERRHQRNGDTYDLDALAHPCYVPELRRRALAGSYRALVLLGETPGRQAAEALIAVATKPPKDWMDADGNVNLGFNLLSRLADHLPPRTLPGEAIWWDHPECTWRRRTMAGVGHEILPAARTVALHWLGREDWGAAEILVWSAQPEDRAALMAAIERVAATKPPPPNQLHMLWRLGYAALLASPDLPDPDPASSLAEAVLWSCRRASGKLPIDRHARQQLIDLMKSANALRCRIGLWGLGEVNATANEDVVQEVVRLMGSSDAEISGTALWIARTSIDPSILEAMLRIAADPRRQEDYVLVNPLIAAGRRADLAAAIIARLIASKGDHGDDAFRSFAAAVLSVRPVGIYGEGHRFPSESDWLVEAARWRTWLEVHGPDIAAHGPIPIGDPRQPNHLLPLGWWFEASDGRRFLRPLDGL